jgi:hypothetical protein
MKPFEEFHRDSAARDGRRPECKACTAARRKAWYAANRQREIARVKEWQQANAERVNEGQRRNRARPERDASLHLDHCHETGEIRGILCGTCNQGLGMFGEDAELLDAAARYLREGVTA